jgi:hypothetical protein
MVGVQGPEHPAPAFSRLVGLDRTDDRLEPIPSPASKIIGPPNQASMHRIGFVDEGCRASRRLSRGSRVPGTAVRRCHPGMAHASVTSSGGTPEVMEAPAPSDQAVGFGRIAGVGIDGLQCQGWLDFPCPGVVMSDHAIAICSRTPPRALRCDSPQALT